jgi:hypothetical protein
LSRSGSAGPDQVEKLLILALAVGFFVVLVLAWYHGERGAQRVSGTEIVILALLLAIGGGLLWRFERVTPTATNPDAAIVATSSRPPGATPALATVFTGPEHVKSTQGAGGDRPLSGRLVAATRLVRRHAVKRIPERTRSTHLRRQ